MKNINKILLVLILTYVSFAAVAQNRQITGIIKDAEGPVPGASVFEKGLTANGTATNLDGKFKLTLRGTGNIITVSSIGYTTKNINVAGKQTITITLTNDARGLEEVVVTGYQTQKKINVTGAVSTISNAELMQTPSSSIQNTLSGKLTGFVSQQRSGQPGGDGATFYVRGVSTPSGNQSPLIVVDNVISNISDFSNIDPNEVESISVLKDAATTAPYGIEGANGVILVTTRRGKAGAPRITLRTEFGVQTPTQVPHFLDSYNTAVLRNLALQNDATIAGGTYTPQFSAADLQKFQDGSDPYGHPNVNWYNTLFKKFAPTNTTNLDISGGTENVQYFVSGGFTNQGGMVRHFSAPGDDPESADVDNNYGYNRYNFRANLDIKASKSLSLQVDLSGNNTVTNTPGFGGAAAVFTNVYSYPSLSPYQYNIYNPDGSYGYTNANNVAANGNNIVGALAYGGYSRALQNLMSINISAIQKLDYITKGLIVRVSLSGANSNSSTSSLTRGTFPQFYYDPVAGTYTPKDATVYRVQPWQLGYVAGSPLRHTELKASINYNNSFGKNNFSAFLQADQSTGIAFNSNTLFNYIPSSLRGFVADMRYNYNNKYNVSFDGSYNGTDKFAADHRYGFFPAASARWNIAEENFVKDKLKFLDVLSLRASYGLVGSDNLPPGILNSYQESYLRGISVGGVPNTVLGSYSFGQTNNNYAVISPSTLANNNVTWERERKLDIGLDFTLFKGKLSGIVDVFRNRRYDILTVLKTVPLYYGVPSSGLPPQNIGIVQNNGFEVELNYNGKIGKNFGYRFKGTYSYAKNKIIEEDEVPPLYPWQRQTGQSIGTNPEWIWDGFYSVEDAANPAVAKFAGSSTAAGGPGTTLPGFLKYRDLNGDGIISDLDKGYFGKSNLPTTILGFNMGFTYKRLSLNVLLQAAVDYTIQVNYAFADPFNGNLQALELSTWTPATAATAQFPALVSNFHGTYQTIGNFSTFWSIPGDYLRIKSVELGYTLPEKWATAAGVKSIRVYANGYNLYTWSAVIKKYGIDPESAQGSYEPAAAGAYPQQAIINLGVNVSIK